MLCGVPDENMARITGCCDVMVQPTQGGGFEIPVLEAMSCAVPPIATDFVGLPELVEGNGWVVPYINKGETRRGKGLYFSPLDATQAIADEYRLADAIEDAYNHPKKRASLGRKARKKAERVYDWRHVHPRYHAILDEVRELQSYKPLKERQL
jgi:glycosyltransferase involved in cell wall biosynthesis